VPAAGGAPPLACASAEEAAPERAAKTTKENFE